MKRGLTIAAAAAMALLSISAPAKAAQKLERVAFQFSGTCSNGQRQLLSALSMVDGVRSVDLSSVPDHALIDIDGQFLSSHDLANIVRQAMRETDCRAEPMESCVSPGAPHRIADASGPLDSRPRPH